MSRILRRGLTISELPFRKFTLTELKDKDELKVRKAKAGRPVRRGPSKEIKKKKKAVALAWRGTPEEGCIEEVLESQLGMWKELVQDGFQIFAAEWTQVT